jgi:hypothetical protein
MHTCMEYKEMANLFVDGELTHIAKLQFEKHIESCPPCQDHYAELLTLKGILSHITEEEPPEAFSFQLHQKLVEENVRLHGTKQNFLTRYHSFLKFSYGLAGTFLIAWVSYLGYGKVSDVITVGQKPTSYEVGTIQMMGSDVLEDENLNIDSKPSSIETDLAITKKDDALALDTQMPKLEIEAEHELLKPDSSTPKTTTPSSTPPPPQTSTAKNASTQPIAESQTTSYSSGASSSPYSPTSRMTESFAKSFADTSKESMISDSFYENHDFTILVEKSPAYVVMEEFLNTDGKLHETNLSFYHENPRELSNFLMRVSNQQRITYTKTDIQRDNPAAPYTSLIYVLNASDYNRFIRAIKSMESSPTQDFIAASAGSSIHLTLYVYHREL